MREVDLRKGKTFCGVNVVHDHMCAECINLEGFKRVLHMKYDKLQGKDAPKLDISITTSSGEEMSELEPLFFKIISNNEGDLGVCGSTRFVKTMGIDMTTLGSSTSVPSFEWIPDINGYRCLDQSWSKVCVPFDG